MDKTTVIREIRSLQRLETASFTIEKIIDVGNSDSQFREILFGDRILLIAYGEVIAGFDFNGIQENNIQITGDKITVTLPPPTILVSKLDNEKTRVYDRKQGLLTRGDKDLESEARKAAEARIRQAACEGGILNEAVKNAKKQMTVLLRSLQFNDITVIIPDSTCQ